jgi:hypothetical protein
MAEPIRLPRSCHVVALSILLALFCLRVAAQLLQSFLELAFLPPFDAWHSGALPYGVLLASQFLIIVFYAWLLRGIATHRTLPNRRRGGLFFIAGLVYFLAMLARMSIGLSGLSGHRWFRSYLPTLFHFVLAGYLIVVGHFHLRSAP